ncbi:MAG: hypothetical protein HFACDABA_02553 [Anaerolineales bacterium]|nr:hypothetical protein [Anaerolineales bacterium]
MSERPVNHKELLSLISREWDSLMDEVSRLDETQMTTPDAGGWSPKDNLAHLTEWMNILLGYHMDKRPAHEVFGVAPEVVEGWDFDRINQVLFERNQPRSTNDVIGEMKKVYAQVVERLTSTPFEDLLKPRHPQNPASGNVLDSVIGDTYEHFAEHRETMQKNRRR